MSFELQAMSLVVQEILIAVPIKPEAGCLLFIAPNPELLRIGAGVQECDATKPDRNTAAG